MPRALDLSGRLQVGVDDRTFELTASGSSVRLEIGDFAPSLRSLRFVRSGGTLARRLGRVLAARAVTLVVTRNGRPIVELGAGVRSGRFARLLGFANVRLVRR